MSNAMIANVSAVLKFFYCLQENKIGLLELFCKLFGVFS